MKIKYALFLISLLALLSTGCHKFLSEKSDKSLAIPTTIEDFQALLDDWSIINGGFSASGEASSDDIYMNDGDFNALNYESDKRLYTYQSDYVSRSVASAGDEWNLLYRAIYVSNSILQSIEDNQLTGSKINDIKGQALVFRAARYLDGVQIWSKVYDKENAKKDLGLVLRLDPDMSIVSKRANVEDTYSQIIKDLTDAIPLLQVDTKIASQASKAAAYGLLARTYLIQGNYKEAVAYAEKALLIKNNLIDFNTLNASANYPIPATNQLSAEIVLLTRMFASDIINASRARISKSLYQLYANNDLRKTIYFREINGEYSFKGTHMGHAGLVTGITTSELYLILAEGYARLGNLKGAQDTLNSLLVKRYNKNSFIPYSFSSKEDALDIVLEERRKELVMRGLRWSDIKRLNRDGANIVLNRTTNNQQYSLAPNDNKYAIAIPEELIQISGIEQNPR